MRRRADRDAGTPAYPCIYAAAHLQPACSASVYHRSYRTLHTLHTLRTLRTLRALQGCLTVARLLGKNAFGYAPTELEGKSVLGILHPADHAPFVQVSN